MKTSILILLLAFTSLLIYGNGESPGKAIKDISGNSNIIFEAPGADDSSSLKKIIPACTSNLTINTTRNDSNPFSFHTIKSLFFKEKCKEPESANEFPNSKKNFYKVFKILMVILSIGLVGLFVSIASVSMLLFVIPL